MEAWIVEQRRKTCLHCPSRPTCPAWKPYRFFFLDSPICPEKKILPRLEAIAARAWPPGAAPVSGCCDPPAHV